MIILAPICSKPIYRMAPCVAPSKFSGVQLEYVPLQGPAGAGRKKGVPPQWPMAQTRQPLCSCNQLSYPAQPCSLETKPFTARHLPLLLSFDHPTTCLHHNSIANNLLHRYQYTSLNMPAQIAQPLPTQQMTASTPADAPRAVDEQPVSLTPHNVQPTNNNTKLRSTLHSIYPTRCLITWPLGIIVSAKLSHTISALLFRKA